MAGRIAYYGNIVKDGLVLCLDAAKRDSYPGSGTVWRDISGFGNNGTLTNGPTFSSANYGSIVFDGVNDYVNLGSSSTTPTAGSMLFWMSGSFQNQYLAVYDRTVGTGAGLTTPIPNDGWVHVGFTGVSGSTNQFIINGVAYNANTGGANPYDLSTRRTIFWISNVSPFTANSGQFFSFHLQPSPGGNSGFSWPSYSNSRILGANATIVNTRYFIGSISSVLLYNRALSAQEILQNYNATKGRYGL